MKNFLKIVFIFISVQLCFAQTLDRFGGFTELPVSGGATGNFHLGTLGNRWVLVTPLGNAFWMLSVDNCTGNVIPEQETALQNKYGQPWWTNGGKFFKQIVIRLRSWEFNTLGEYAAIIAWPGVNPDSMPFIQIINPSRLGLLNNSITQSVGGSIKDIIDCTDPAIYNGWRGNGFPDAFDPMFPEIIKECIKQNNQQNKINIKTTPWLIMTSMDDRDNLVGFGPASTHPHLGWIAAVTAPIKNKSTKYNVSYTDTLVHTKFALQAFLQSKYETINALNNAWGATYTTWDSDGGWPNGKGFLDESGRNSWIGKDFYNLQTATLAVRNDLDSFLVLLADNYFSVSSTVIKASIPGKLVCGPSSINIKTRPSILIEEGKYVDVISGDSAPDSTSSNYDVAAIYNITGKPFYDGKYITANKDSPLSAYQGNIPNDYPTQEQRGTAYAESINNDLGCRGKDGKCPVIGSGWWSWTDSPGEKMNWGLVTILDNAYDGIEARKEAGTDKWGYSTGGESKDYGNLLTAMLQAHSWVFDSLKLTTNGVDEQHGSNSNNAENLIPIQIYPNPANDNLKIRLLSNEFSSGSLKVINELGLTVWEMKDLKQSIKGMEYDISNLQSGVFFCLFKNGENLLVKKFIVLK
jgi:hypothetical protein